MEGCRQRQLDPEEYLPSAHPHASGRFNRVGSTCWMPTFVFIKITGSPSTVRRDDHGREPESERRRELHGEQECDGQDRKRRNRPSDVRELHGPELPAPGVTNPQADAAGDRAPRHRRDHRQLHVLPHPSRDAVDPDQFAGSRPATAGPREPAHLPTARTPDALAHGVTSRCSPSSSRSAANAEATESTTPTSSGVQKNVFRPSRMN